MKKTILITGASSGIGKATAKFFAAKGWNVIATMRNPGAEKELNQLNNLLVAKLDVQQPDTISLAIAKAIEKFGKIDALLNNPFDSCLKQLEITKWQFHRIKI